MVKIRLMRAGARSKPFYRLVAIDERRQRDGRNLDLLGTYDPKTQPVAIQIDLERVDHWLGRGARLSETARSLVGKARAAAGSAQ
jgi:small subunit ribosomal protein S16